ncbi:uncharacterized protein [Spinacia oleracea]|uniref:Myb/SANT-like domain-containing protein n=1 Tax=Spinacia oleracea TaxID=3562 RepID=A0A9R0JJM0_SPIOL|nr:uncharacterized protein LOC110776518 [Spinacia oleracea]
MAPIGRKATFLPPGRLGLSRSVGSKVSFLSGVLAKAPSKTTTSNDNPDANVPTMVSEVNQGTINEASMEEDMSHAILLQSLREDVGNDESDIIQRSINNAAISDFLEQQNALQDALTTQKEAHNPTLRKRNRKPDAKPRGVNKCKKVANLKDGEKLEVEFYMNGAVGDNHKDLTRHMGKLVRDRIICPVRVHTWDEIDNSVKEHMWQSVLNKFVGKGFDLDRKTTIDHLKRLWQNWRGILNQNSIIRKGGLENALNETPNDLTPADWKWLVEEHFSSEAFKKLSSRNSGNRGNLTMLHHTGSTPFRQVIWEDMGGKEGKYLPPISAVFKKTREGKSGNLKENDATKLDEIVSVEKENPSLSQFEVVEKFFGPQDRGGVVCFGFGIRPKDVRGPLPTRADLTSRAHEKQKENDDLRKRMDEMEKVRQADLEKMSALEEKFNLFLAAYMQQPSFGDQEIPDDS